MINEPDVSLDALKLTGGLSNTFSECIGGLMDRVKRQLLYLAAEGIG